MKKEINIDEEFDCGLTRLKCMEDDAGECRGCFFEYVSSKMCKRIIGDCDKGSRSDHKDVIFIEI